MESRAIGALTGLACGDAVGTTLEFQNRNTLTPITDMVGGGPFYLNPGEWTDDTSMALCLGYSLLDNAGYNADDQMKRYVDWYLNGTLSSNGECFDIGHTVKSALQHYIETGDPISGPTGLDTSGNGSIMRLAPIPLFFSQDLDLCLHYAGESSRTTHGSPLCLSACRLLALLISRALVATSKQDIFINLGTTLPTSDRHDELIPILDGSFVDLEYHQLTGSGYVIESLISAVWCFYHGRNFREAILLAANLGDDADTTAAVCGQLAGAFYGLEGIPSEWTQRLVMTDKIQRLARDLYHLGKVTYPGNEC